MREKHSTSITDINSISKLFSLNPLNQCHKVCWEQVCHKKVVEKQILNRFITESDKDISLTLLKGEIRKACKLAEKIVKVVNDTRNKNENINIFKIKKILENEFNIKIESAYLNFLTEIVRNYFGIQLPSLSECFLGFL